MATFSPHIALDVDGREGAVSLYREVFGMEVVEETAGETVLQCGDLSLYVMESDEPKVFLEFEVDDLSAALEAFDETGCTVEAVETPEASPSYLVSDPFGTHYHVFERTDRP